MNNGQLFSAVLQPNETIYSKAILFASFAGGVKDNEIARDPRAYLEKLFERMRVTKQPLISIYKKSTFGELKNSYAYLNVAVSSFHRVVDSFLRSSNNEQLHKLQQLQVEKHPDLLKLLREHEFIVLAFCEYRAEN